MIQNKIQLQFNPKLFYCFQCLAGSIHLVQRIINHRKASVQIRMVQTGQNIAGRKCSLCLFRFQKIYNIIQGSAQTIRVEIQHRSYVHNIFPFYF